MKWKLKIKNYYRFICSIIIFIVIILLTIVGITNIFSKHSENNKIISDELTSSSLEISKSENKENKEENKNHKTHKSRVMPLNNGEKSDKALPVLMYHYFYDDINGETALNSNFMPISSFEKQLNYLNENNYYYPTWDEVADFVDGKIDLPDKSVVLTMDDGDESVFNLALPLLEKYEVTATAFIITSIIDENELKKYADSIIDLESHTDDMHRGGGTYGHGGIFPALSLEESTEDLKTSIRKLGGNSGALAYPFGDCTKKTKEAAKNAGFKVAFTTSNDKVTPGMDKYELPRVRMFTEISLEGFKYSISN